ncbi:MAG TPA: chromosome partitioning protein ParB, partial [Anaerolineae bacterium]|nr:chromosome partitioning protein ParB [Anaerolineae bacterium]
KMIIDGTLAPGSARALVTVDDKDIQYKLARKIASEGLSAREAEQLVKTTLLRKTHTISEKEVSPFLEACREDLQRTFGTVVKIKGNEVKGKIEIAYYTQDDLERILEILKGEPLE